MSPRCCRESEQNRTVTFFLPAAQSSPAHWVVPIRLPDEDTIANRCSAPASFCPFCGTKLTREHVPFWPEAATDAPPQDDGGS